MTENRDSNQTDIYLGIGEEKDGVLISLRRFSKNVLEVFVPLVRCVTLANFHLQMDELETT